MTERTTASLGFLFVLTLAPIGAQGAEDAPSATRPVERRFQAVIVAADPEYGRVHYPHQVYAAEQRVAARPGSTLDIQLTDPGHAAGR